MEFETVVGLEIHSELATKTKIFCGCPTSFGGGQNTHCCPICTGMPGVLPVLNKKVVEYAVRAGMAMNCHIANFSKLDRKNYFYPDLPKAYQISQYDLPLCSGGYVALDSGKKIGITRIHIEEDAGKLNHDSRVRRTYVDYNRCGVPLIEIVSEPDLRGADEAREFVEKVRAILLYAGVSDCRMEEGSLRADVNLSVRPAGSGRLGTRTETKNINSLRAIFRAVEAETERQQDVIVSGGSVTQETRRWDDDRGYSYAMRGKEQANDYRYFPEPDIVPIRLSDERLDEIRASLPELPGERRKRYAAMGVSDADAVTITASRATADFFEIVARDCDPAEAAKWVVGELMHDLKEHGLEPEQIPFPPARLVEIIHMSKKGTVTASSAKKVLSLLFESGDSPAALVEKYGLAVVSDRGAIDDAVERALAANPKSVADYFAGKEKALGYLMGQCMRLLKGKGDPAQVREALASRLSAASHGG